MLSISKRFYPQQPSGQAVVSRVFPSPPPVHAFIVIAQRVHNSELPLFQLLTPVDFPRTFANSRSRGFPLVIFLTKEKNPHEHERALGRIRPHIIDFIRDKILLLLHRRRLPRTGIYHEQGTPHLVPVELTGIHLLVYTTNEGCRI